MGSTIWEVKGVDIMEGRKNATPLAAHDDLLPLPTDTDELNALPTDLPRHAPVPSSSPTLRTVDLLNPASPVEVEDDGVIITETAGVDVSAFFRPAKPPRPTGKPRTKRETNPAEELGYRFPYGRVIIEPVSENALNTFAPGTFQVRLVWHRGKAVLPLIESTPLRHMGQVTLNGQKYPIFLNQHSRKRRDRIVFGGKRKTAKSARCMLRFVTFIEGREDKFFWHWRIAATAAAIAYNESNRVDAPEAPIDEVSLYLPFAPGKAQIITQPDAPNVLALWLNDIVMTVATGEASGVQEGFSETPVLFHDGRGFTLTLRGANLSGAGVSLRWETWFAAARTEPEARAALLRHAADIADRLQRPFEGTLEDGSLVRLMEENERLLMADDLVDKRGADRIAYHPQPGDRTFICGQGADTALTSAALLGRYYMTGDDALRRRARLVSRGVCDFQINLEDSPHWGAIWDANQKKRYVDAEGGDTLSVTTTARAAKGLHIAHGHFGVEILQRTALAATQWLMLKMGMDGFMASERFHEDGRAVANTSSPWVAGEVLLPIVETFRVNQNEVFIKVALRTIAAMRNGLDNGTLRFEQATVEQLAATIEGILLVSREYESEEMIAFAKRLIAGLRVRRLPDGSFGESPLVEYSCPLTATLAGARASLALTRVDSDPMHLLTAMRAVRVAGQKARAMREQGEWVNIATQTGLLMHSMGVLLAVAQRAPGLEADRDRVLIKRGWQTFAPDPATREYVQVTLLDGTPVDHMALVCPVSHQVLVAVLAPPNIGEVKIIKNGKTPFMRGLLDNSYEMRANLLPLGEGTEANIGVFLADT